MSSVLDRPRFRDRITDDDWKTGDTSTASTQRMTLVGWPTTVRRFSFPFLQGQLLVEWDGPLPDWFEQAIASLDELGDLESNWDSYGAKRIRHSPIVAAGLARSKKQGVARDPHPDEPAHALVFGNKTASVSRALAKGSVWVTEPPADSTTQGS